ncbi:PH domain-containing protein [Shewanella sp. MMG014]|uniref:PH domain-containing protein n=1 Tax=Shewanella sp. MMG014 TaxID=2822691 RepID=UPI001B37B00A|nr:PH domain-containing protein [Shewanella sp. MMG014]MBQ4889838.1 PH domain-containing protein [Shewanella sp. MMG014]
MTKIDDKSQLEPTQWQPYNALTLTPVDKRYPIQAALQISIIVLIILTAIMVLMNIQHTQPLTDILIAITAITSIGTLWISLKYQAAKKVYYGVLKHELVMRKGLWWVKTTTLPFSRLQHVSLSQNPIQRQFNLATLKCFSAGSGAAEINLPGLKFETAEHLRQHLLHRATSHQQDKSIPEQVKTELQPDSTDIEPVNTEHLQVEQQFIPSVQQTAAHQTSAEQPVISHQTTQSETAENKLKSEKQDD